MSTIKHIFILNPAAGRGAEWKRLGEAIQDACTAAGEPYEVYITKARGDATRFVREAIESKPENEVYRFYACGGDGTLSEVVNGAASRNTDTVPGPLPGVEVGCMPIGTGNDFVRNFTNPVFFTEITKQILADAVPIDCFKCDDSLYGVNMINIGFDCEVAVRAAENKKKKFLPKSLAYVAGIVTELKKNEGKRMRVDFGDGNVTEREFQLVSAANGGFCGGGFHSAPRSLLSDGELDISLIDKVSRTTFLKLVGPYKKGTHLDTKVGRRVVHYTKAKNVTIEFDGITNICIDGEIIKADRLSLSVVPNALAFAIPVGCEVRVFDL